MRTEFNKRIKGLAGSQPATRVDLSSMVPMPAGGFVTHFGKQAHRDGGKDEEARMLILGQGPAAPTRVEQAK